MPLLRDEKDSKEEKGGKQGTTRKKAKEKTAFVSSHQKGPPSPGWQVQFVEGNEIVEACTWELPSSKGLSFFLFLPHLKGVLLQSALRKVALIPQNDSMTPPVLVPAGRVCTTVPQLLTSFLLWVCLRQGGKTSKKAKQLWQKRRGEDGEDILSLKRKVFLKEIQRSLPRH